MVVFFNNTFRFGNRIRGMVIVNGLEVLLHDPPSDFERLHRRLTRKAKLIAAIWRNLLGICSFVHPLDALSSAPRGFTNDHLLQHLAASHRFQLRFSGFNNARAEAGSSASEGSLRIVANLLSSSV